MTQVSLVLMALRGYVEPALAMVFVAVGA